MKRLAVAATFVALTLGGCNSSSLSNIGAQVANDLPTACAVLSGADTAFRSYAVIRLDDGHPIPSRYITDETAAFDGVVAVCANPQSVRSVPGVVATVLGAYAVVMADVAAAKGATAAPAKAAVGR